MKPTRNRFVNFTPADKDPVFAAYGKIPFSALIVHVFSDKMVNLMVFYPNGDIKPATSVTLLDGNETEDELKALKKFGRFAEWPVVTYPTQTLKVGLEVDTSQATAALADLAAAKKAAGV
jgi:hypothetical protein